ncbi:MAG TPA: AroM family protein [Candidatus Limnocylindrales bacterium]|nr:AroM family protein [Candidatus Limnocylindrales bacterium]
MSEPVTIGAISIGQSPRPDLLAPLRGRLPADRVTIVEIGALDGLSVDGRAVPAAAGYPLTTRLRDGSAVTVDEAFLEPLVQAAVDEVERRGCVVSILLCAGGFAGVHGTRPIVRPFEIAVATLHSLGIEWIAVVVPIEAQVEPSRRKWSTTGLSAVIRSARLHDAPAAIARDVETGVEAVVLDYVGHPADAVRRLRGLLDRPVIDPGDLAAATLASLVAAR